LRVKWCQCLQQRLLSLSMNNWCIRTWRARLSCQLKQVNLSSAIANHTSLLQQRKHFLGFKVHHNFNQTLKSQVISMIWSFKDSRKVWKFIKLQEHQFSQGKIRTTRRVSFCHSKTSSMTQKVRFISVEELLTGITIKIIKESSDP